MVKILITGGTGFIGSNLAQEMVGRGYEVVLLDLRRNTGNIAPFSNKINFYQMDVCDQKGMADVLAQERVDGIIHLAAVSRVIQGEQDPIECVRTNESGTMSLLNAIRKSTIKPWVVFGSSREVYGEPEFLPVTEEHPKLPMNVYGRSKLRGEEMIRQFTREQGLNGAILRFSNVYGNERDIPDRVIPRFILAALKGKGIEIHGGNQIVDFTHISDTVQGINAVGEFLENHKNNGNDHWCQDFHLLPGCPFTLQQVANTISEHLDQEIPITITKPRTYDVERFHGDPDKAAQMLGFKAMVLPREGIRMTIDRYREVMTS